VRVVPRCLTVASSDSSGGAGIQADLKAFAAAGCYGTSAIVALTAQNTKEIRAILAVPPDFVRAQLNAVVSDIGCDAAKTGALVSRTIVEVVAAFFAEHPVPLVVDPVMVASSGHRLLAEDAVDALVRLLLPLATVVTPNLAEAEVLAGLSGHRRALAERIVSRGARAVIITGGHTESPHDHLFDGTEHVEIAQRRVPRRSTHGSGCTHSATLTAEIAKGASLRDAASTAAGVSAAAIAAGFEDIGSGEGPVDVLRVTAR
jgi:hydroxymethylpyrimidine kinase/phosphomethylpyrimidine kinase